MNTEPRTCRCDNCGHTESAETIRPIHECKDVEQRIDPGSVVPAGECSKCGCFTYYQQRGQSGLAALPPGAQEAIAACRTLVDAYGTDDDGDGSSVEWSDVDAAYYSAVEALRACRAQGLLA